MGTQNITDYDIQALVDGEIDDPASIRILEHILKDPALYNRYMLYKRQKQILKSWWKDN